MKILLVFSLLLASALCLQAAGIDDDIPNFDMDEELSPEDLRKLKDLVAKELELLGNKKLEDETTTTAFINEFWDKLLANARILLVKEGLDPTTLPDALDINIEIGRMNLTEGQLNDTSTIERYENATLSYDIATKILVTEMVLRFEDIKFLYKYHTQVTFISTTGHLHGDIEHIHIHLKMGFDFSNYTMFVESIDFKHTGSITISVSGNAAIDWISNAMIEVSTVFLHDLILSWIKDMFADPLNSIVDTVNGLFHPSS